MIKNITLQFGMNGKTDKLSFSPGPITVFVGPNNSGKSLILREIENYCQMAKTKSQLILDDIVFDLPDDSGITEQIKTLEIKPEPNENIPAGHTKYGKLTTTQGWKQFTLDISSLLHWKRSNPQAFNTRYISLFTARLGGKERFNLIQSRSNEDIKMQPTSTLSALFQDNKKREQVRDIIYEAFRKYFVIDPTDMKNLVIRLSDTAPPSTEIEKGWDTPSGEFHSKAKSIDEFSDGVQAFVGLVLSVSVGTETIMLVDEPDAFLHPSLATVFGKRISTIMSQRNGNLLVSTHSSNFLMGCIQSGKPLNIIRLTYDENHYPTARMLSADRVSQLFKNPLLRSTGTLQALFYNAVVVTEGDTDRAFYNEINERMLSYTANGIENCLFANAQNKQTICDIIKPLREMGIPAAAIVDIDVFKEGGKTFTKLLNGAFIPDGLHQSFSNLRASIFALFSASGKDMKTEGGIDLLTGDNKETCNKFVLDFAEYGIFIVPNGEVESWLEYLGQKSGHGSSWLIPIFEKMGSDQLDANYVKPIEGDVWDFISRIKKWVNDNKRKGIPTEVK